MSANHDRQISVDSKDDDDKLPPKRTNQNFQEEIPKKRSKGENEVTSSIVDAVVDLNSEFEHLPLTEKMDTNPTTQIHYQYLIAVFPEADKTYLHEICEGIAGNDEEMNEFIETTLESKDYLNYSDDWQKQQQCGCCYGEEFIMYEMVACRKGHLFCQDCVARAAEVAVGNGKTSLQCLTNCEAEFSIEDLETVVKPAVFSRMFQAIQLQEIQVAGIEGLESCIHCNFTALPAEGDSVFRCQNPECMKATCRFCKEPNHLPLRCDEVEKSAETKMRTMIEDRMTEALVRNCWKCNRTFIKEDGCNKMACICGALMCYVCRNPVRCYSHFNTHGGKCPLYSDNRELHVEAVKKAALKAKKEVLAKNPQVRLKVDPTKILPK